jgi:four helix bundle protein
MASWSSFEEIEAWKKARNLCNEVYLMTNQLPLKTDFDLCRQIKRSCGSIMDNIAEGFERGGNKEFIQFLIISKGSCGEFRSQLYRLIDLEFINKSTFDKLYLETIELSKMISGIISYLKNNEFKGPKYK